MPTYLGQGRGQGEGEVEGEGILKGGGQGGVEGEGKSEGEDCARDGGWWMMVGHILCDVAALKLNGRGEVLQTRDAIIKVARMVDRAIIILSHDALRGRWGQRYSAACMMHDAWRDAWY